MADPNGLEVVVALATVVGTGATVAAAVAAWRAANASSDAADRAARALGLHMKPALDVRAVRGPGDDWTRVAMEVRNVGAFTATDVTLTVTRLDGARRAGGPERLATDQALVVEVAPTYPTGDAGWASVVDEAIVRYRDSSGAARWEKRYGHSDGGWRPISDLPID
jgi:hypothetical protein